MGFERDEHAAPRGGMGGGCRIAAANPPRHIGGKVERHRWVGYAERCCRCRMCEACLWHAQTENGVQRKRPVRPRSATRAMEARNLDFRQRSSRFYSLRFDAGVSKSRWVKTRNLGVGRQRASEVSGATVKKDKEKKCK